MSKFILRKSLYKISSHLGREDLKSIKFLCSDDLPRRKLDSLHSAFEVFCALEARGFIDYGNTVYLSFLLNGIGKVHLLTKYPIEAIMSPVPQPVSVNISNKQMKSTRTFLVEISESFSEKEFRILANFFFDPGASALTYEDIEQMTGAEDLFRALLDERVIQPTDLSQLSIVLGIIGRNDLKEKVTHHQQQEVCKGNQVVNPTPETTLPSRSNHQIPLHFPSTSSLGASDSLMFSPTTPSVDHYSYGSSGQSMSLDCHPPGVFFGPMHKPQMQQAQYPLIQNQVLGNSTGTVQGTAEHSLIAQGQVYRECGGYPGDPSPSNAELQRELQKSRKSEERLSQQLKQLSETQKDQQEMIQRLVKEKKYLEQETFRNPHSYVMNQKPHGLAVVIGNEIFDTNPNRPSLKFEQRKGCECDIQNYATSFEYLEYDVSVHRNLRASEIKELVAHISTKDHSQYDSFVFCISTHGEDNHFIFGSDTKGVDMNEVISQIQGTRTLSGKPKMFFVQACRTKAADVVCADGDPPKSSYHPDADVFVAFATTPFHSSYRSPDYGSWFVVALASIVTESALSLDLQSILTEVNATVCEAEGDDGTSIVRQCVETISRLTASVYFFPSL